MKPSALLLALSVAVNALALARLSRPEPRPAPPARVAVPACRHEDPPPRKIERVTQEVAAVAPAPPVFVQEDELSALLHDQDAISRLFARLDQLRAVRSRLSREKVEQAALRFTAEALGLEAAFAEAVRAPLEDLRRAALVHEEELSRIASGSGSVPAALSDVFEDQRRRSREGVAACLDASPLHQLFRERLDEWFTCVLAE